MSRGTLDSARSLWISHTGLSPSLTGLSRTFLLSAKSLLAVLTPHCTQRGLGSFHFARRYFGNRFFFLFLRLLRCFSSPGSLRYTMDSYDGNWSLSSWVSPFRYLRIMAYLQLPAAFRSLSRLSSALSAKASSLCSFMLDHTLSPLGGVLATADSVPRHGLCSVSFFSVQFSLYSLGCLYLSYLH